MLTGLGFEIEPAVVGCALVNLLELVDEGRDNSMLFDKKGRIRTSPMKPGENEYAFYDSSARYEFEVYRDILNSWVAELPDVERLELISRFRKSDSLGYQATLAELTIYIALRRCGYSVEIHPLCGHPARRPDFLAQKNAGMGVAFVEVTTFGPASEEVSSSNRYAAIFNALDKMRLPGGQRLGLDINEYGKTAPSLKKLSQEVLMWVSGMVEGHVETMPTRTFTAGDWSIDLTLYPPPRGGGKSERTIASSMGSVRYISAETEIRQALERKGNRYGVLNAPYLIVVADCKDELSGGESNGTELLEAVFGTIVDEGVELPSGEWTHRVRRLADGYWGRPEAPKHRNVSGVMLLPKPHLWDLRSHRWQPLLVRNPWAQYALPEDLLSLPDYRLTDKDRFKKVEGVRLADILGLPAVWPPEN